jgi:hypothetical protein
MCPFWRGGTSEMGIKIWKSSHEKRKTSGLGFVCGRIFPKLEFSWQK